MMGAVTGPRLRRDPHHSSSYVEERLWVADAHAARHTRVRQPPTFVDSRGMTEAEALRKLAVALRSRLSGA